MIDELSTYLEEVSSRPFEWGKLDCALFAAGWVEEVTGIDVRMGLHRRYKTAKGCNRLLKSEGGLQSITERGLRLADMRPTDEPERGDVALCDVLTPNGRGHAVGICLGENRFVFLGLNGLVVTRARLVAAWEF